MRLVDVARSSSLFLVLAFATQSGAQTPQQVAQKLFLKTLVLVLEGADGRPASLGSGFVIGAGVVATNRHVIRGAVRGFGKYVGTTQRLEIEGLLADSAEHDLALLKIPAASVPSVDLGNGDAVEIGEAAYANGSPVGLEGTFSNGIVSGFRSVGGERLIQITAPISPGSSGGPVADRHPRLLRRCNARPDSRRAAEKGYELPPPHSNFRGKARLTLCAKSGPEHAQQTDELKRPYSITSSARASSVGGTERPIADCPLSGYCGRR